MLREVTVKIGLKMINTKEGVIVEVLLDSGAMGLVMSLEFARKQEFKLKKIKRPIYVRNVNGTFNKERPIENMVEVNIYYQGYRERMEIDVIGGQKWNVILEMPWIAHHNSKIDWRIEEVKITRCLEKCKKQGKSGWQKQKKEERKEEIGKKWEEREEKQKKEKKKPKKERKKDRSKKSSRRIGDLG